MKKITINDIAKMAKTSKTTVSFYLNNKFDAMSEETKNRIKKVIDETNYSPSLVARSLSMSKTNLIGVIIGDITNVFSNQIVKGIEAYLNKYNYQIIIGNSNYEYERESKLIDKFIQIGVEGFIVQPTTNFLPLIEKIKRSGKQLAFIDSNLENDEVVSIKSDNYNSVYKCMETIVNKNKYDRYIMIGASPAELSTRKERAKGFIDSLEIKNIPFHNIIVSNEPTIEEVKRKLLTKLLDNKKTLIFVPNCWLLPIVNQVLDIYRDKMPKNIGLVGFDNIEWCKFVCPKITTIVQPAYEEGYLVAEYLVNMIEKKEEVLEKKVTLMCNVNWEKSVEL